MNAYEAASEEFPSVLDDKQKEDMIDSFMKRSYTMTITVKDKKEKVLCPVKVVDLKKESESKYRISMTGKDKYGASSLNGLVIFRAEGIGFKLSKVYNDRKKAGQTEKFDILLYEGEGNPDKIEGEWAFNGYESASEFSGTWTMTAK